LARRQACGRCLAAPPAVVQRLLGLLRHLLCLPLGLLRHLLEDLPSLLAYLLGPDGDLLELLQELRVAMGDGVVGWMGWAGREVAACGILRMHGDILLRAAIRACCFEGKAALWLSSS
jgi:hypothetical protein